ncbi:hypothetical protein Gohar_015364, partial [Gossypium harknessii]|nr:hypothetical protein [Gossypium harknessii]
TDGEGVQTAKEGVVKRVEVTRKRVEATREGDVEGVEAAEEGDVEGIEVVREGDVEKVKDDREGVTTAQFEADEFGGEESGGHMSLGSTVGEDNDSGFRLSVGHENAADFVTLVGEDNVAAATYGEEELEAVLDENETKVWDSDEHGCLVGSDKDEEHEDGERMTTIQNYSKDCRRQLKFLKNEPKRVVIKTFQEKLNCLVSFKNKIVTVAMIAQHFKATIKDHLKMKLREIQRIYASEMHNYVQELRSRMPSSTIKVVVQRVIADSPPHFKSEFLTVVRRDANNQMFPIAWDVVEVDCIDLWGLEIAISDILTRIEHRNCERNVFANWSGKKLGKSFEFNFWKIMKSTIERESFLGATCKSDLVDNNLCEAFNSSIVEARFKSIIRMLEDIGTKMMTRIVQKKKLYNGWKQNYGPPVKAKFDANKKDYVEWQLI